MGPEATRLQVASALCLCKSPAVEGVHARGSGQSASPPFGAGGEGRNLYLGAMSMQAVVVLQLHGACDVREWAASAPRRTLPHFGLSTEAPLQSALVLPTCQPRPQNSPNAARRSPALLQPARRAGPPGRAGTPGRRRWRASNCAGATAGELQTWRLNYRVIAAAACRPYEQQVRGAGVGRHAVERNPEGGREAFLSNVVQRTLNEVEARAGRLVPARCACAAWAR